MNMMRKIFIPLTTAAAAAAAAIGPYAVRGMAEERKEKIQVDHLGLQACNRPLQRHHVKSHLSDLRKCIKISKSCG